MNNNYPLESLIEMMFELARRATFPDKPSRFQALFACETLDEAKECRKRIGQQHHDIFKVSGDIFLKADMSLLKLGGSVAEGFTLAHKYWNGSAGPTPFWEILPSPDTSLPLGYTQQHPARIIVPGAFEAMIHSSPARCDVM